MIKKLLTADIPKFISIVSNAYPSMDAHKPEIRDIYMKKFEEICKHAKEVKVYGCYREKELLGGMLIYDYKMNYYNHMIDVCGLGTVATDFIHKKEHVAKELVSYFIDYGKK
ncbi:MAG TPA: GNAT family N-acetyltransferase, partial [Petrotogaceae bacterium]|nr:GNAT family N-acetyltransferase [Petrotogaceae bacterium]